MHWQKYWFGLNLQEIKAKYTINSERYTEVCNESDFSSVRAICTKQVENLISKIIVGSVDTEILAKRFLEKKEEIKSIFAESAADESAQETVIELDKDGPNSVSQQVLSKARIAALTKTIKRDLISEGYALVKEDGGASTTSASEKKKKRLAKEKKAEKLAKAKKAERKKKKKKEKSRSSRNSATTGTGSSNKSQKSKNLTDDSASASSASSLRTKDSRKKNVSWN